MFIDSREQFDLNLDEDSKNYLLQSLSNDRMISSHELEKIILFYKDRSKTIDLDEIKEINNNKRFKLTSIVCRNKKNNAYIIIGG